MATYAVVENGVVVNLVLAESADDVAGQAVLADENARIGGTYVDGAFVLPPAPAPTVADVTAERDRRTSEGTTINVPGIGDIPVSGSPVVQADLTSLAQAAQIAIAAGNLEAMFPFRDRAGATHALTPEQVVSLFMSGVDWLASVRAAAWALMDADPIPDDYKDSKHWP
jgi:hypothetical protein